MTDATPLSGEWTVHAIAEHRQTLQALLEQGVTTLELSGVTEFDSAGLQLLVAARKSLAARGQELALLAPSTAVRALLTVYGLDETLHDIDTREAA